MPSDFRRSFHRKYSQVLDNQGHESRTESLTWIFFPLIFPLDMFILHWPQRQNVNSEGRRLETKVCIKNKQTIRKTPIFITHQLCECG